MSKNKSKKRVNSDSNKAFLIIMTIALVLLLGVWIVKDGSLFNKKKETDVTGSANYNSFKTVTISKVLDLIKGKEPVFIYFGYKGCNACDKFTPILTDLLDEYDFDVYFLNIKELDSKSSEWKDFTKKLTKKLTIVIKKDGQNIQYNKKMGDFLYDNGYTPSFAVFKDGKFVDGNIGILQIDDLKEFLNNAGFSKK